MLPLFTTSFRLAHALISQAAISVYAGVSKILDGAYNPGSHTNRRFIDPGSVDGHRSFHIRDLLSVMLVLGISAYYHDSAAALIRDGAIVAAAQEERFSRKKNDADFPKLAIGYCLDQTGISLDQIDYVAFYDKPLLTFDRLLETYIAFAPRGFESFAKAMPVWMRQKIFLESDLRKNLNLLDRGKVAGDKLVFGYHHHSHAASAFYPSPFEKSAILVMDGVGEWATTSLGVGDGNTVTLTDEIRFPHSLGLLYSAITYYLGFEVNEGEYKVMGLAPYGEPIFLQKMLDNLIDLKSDGSFRLNLEYFNYAVGLTMTNRKFDQLFGGPPRHPAAPLTQRDMDIARSVQAVTEEVVLRLAHTLHDRTGLDQLCMAGGVALNCVANGRLLRDGPFRDIWIQPAAGDAGGAIGVALAVAHTVGGQSRSKQGTSDGMSGSYLGPQFEDAAISAVFESWKANYQRFDDERLFDVVAEALAAGKVVGWFQGRMEFGPRALGNRSILADARSAKMQRAINLKVKYRESFRPFAPLVLREDVAEWFEINRDSPYMLLVANVASSKRRSLTDAERARRGLARLGTPRSEIPAVTHVDDSARIQTVTFESNPRLYSLLKEFKAKTGCGVLVNTSFNVRDEPIVCSPDDAYRCFMGSEIDMLVAGNYVLLKELQR